MNQIISNTNHIHCLIFFYTFENEVQKFELKVFLKTMYICKGCLPLTNLKTQHDLQKFGSNFLITLEIYL